MSRQSSDETLREYIMHGLPRAILSQNQDCYTIMKFLEYDCISREVTLLIAGDDPQTHSNICRDVFIDGFVRVFVRPCLLTKFPDLATVSYLKTTNVIYDMAVNLLGGRVEYAIH